MQPGGVGTVPVHQEGLRLPGRDGVEEDGEAGGASAGGPRGAGEGSPDVQRPAGRIASQGGGREPLRHGCFRHVRLWWRLGEALLPPELGRLGTDAPAFVVPSAAGGAGDVEHQLHGVICCVVGGGDLGASHAGDDGGGERRQSVRPLSDQTLVGAGGVPAATQTAVLRVLEARHQTAAGVHLQRGQLAGGFAVSVATCQV